MFNSSSDTSVTPEPGITTPSFARTAICCLIISCLIDFLLGIACDIKKEVKIDTLQLSLLDKQHAIIKHKIEQQEKNEQSDVPAEDFGLAKSTAP